jgi:hypothetical protein
MLLVCLAFSKFKRSMTRTGDPNRLKNNQIQDYVLYIMDDFEALRGEGNSRLGKSRK